MRRLDELLREDVGRTGGESAEGGWVQREGGEAGNMQERQEQAELELPAASHARSHCHSW